MNARPKLHEVGSLISQAREKSPRVAITSVKVMPVMARVAESPSEFEAPPTDMLDEAIDAVVDAQAPEDIFGNLTATSEIAPQKKVSDFDFIAELTESDKIEAVCEKIHPAVRAFIEEELRGRFVAVRG